MARPPGVSGGRPHVVCARFSDAEVEFIDKIRGSLARSEWVRWLVLQERKKAQ